jgi:hypothetical protein
MRKIATDAAEEARHALFTGLPARVQSLDAIAKVPEGGAACLLIA